MKSTKYIIYFIILAAGVLLGYGLWGGGDDESAHVHGKTNEQNIDTIQKAHEHAEDIYTCSMHPQIRQEEPGDCPICGMDLIVAENESSTSGPGEFMMSADAVKLAQVQTSVVEHGSIRDIIQLNGRVERNPELDRQQSIHFSGRVEEAGVTFEGQYVEKGQTIARIYAPEVYEAWQELIEAKQSGETMPGMVEAAKTQLKLMKFPDSRIKEMAKADKAQPEIDIYAEHSGFVHNLQLEPGQYLNKGKVLYHTNNQGKVWVVFDVYERDLARVNAGNRVDFAFKGLPGESFFGKINYIDPAIDASRQVANARITVANPRNRIKPGMTVRGELLTAKKGEELLIPKSAVLWTGIRSVAYVARESDSSYHFEFRNITTGQSAGNKVAVLDGLREGEKVVTQGAFTIDAAAQLNGKHSMMSHPNEEDHQHYTKAASNVLKGKFDNFLANYLKFKDALVTTNYDGAKAHLANLQLPKVESQGLSAADYMQLQDRLQAIQDAIKQMRKAEKIEGIRARFKPFSANVIALMRQAGTQKGSVYIQYCPMADQDRGGFWLSTEQQIANPYFGDMMLRCGEVRDSI